MRKDAAATEALASLAAFALVLAACGTTTSYRSNGTSLAVVGGNVTAGPTCPVERPDRECPPRPVMATVDATVGTRMIASTRSASDGTFRLALPIGSYTLTAGTGTSFPRCFPIQLNVVTGVTTSVDITCDTGIR